MLRAYETIYVLSPDASDDQINSVDSKLKSFIASSNGRVGNQDNWGVRDLNYPIKKKTQGKYLYINYMAESSTMKDIEFYLRITESVLTFLTVKLPEETNLEEFKLPNVKDLM